MVSELVGWGFNGFGQLSSSDTAQDIKAPAVLQASDAQDARIRVMFVGWSDVVYRNEGKLVFSGYGAPGRASLEFCSSAIQIFGDHTGIKGAVTSEGEIRWAETAENESMLALPSASFGAVNHVAIAGNGKVCVVTDKSRIFSFDSLEDIHAKNYTRIWNLPTRRIVQLEANETSFTVLTYEGEVFTWGDPRHSLGREITDDEPASEPCIVQALEGLRIAKISCGGWMAGAVSADRDLYIWGRAGPGDDGDIEHLPETPEDVGLVDLGDGIDVVDVALGAGHVLALTSRGDVYGVGRNEYGQTGSDTNGAFQRRWTKAVGFWKGVITAVYSGSGASSSLAVAELHQLRK